MILRFNYNIMLRLDYVMEHTNNIYEEESVCII